MPMSGSSGCATATLPNAVDFITIHILPYWEDFPIPAGNAAAHVDAIRRQVVDAFPGKEVIIGEVGWPSAGRMREGALPSPANQARVIQDVLALGKRENFRVNVIEAFDQPWKRALEGTVGGHWGLLDGHDARAEIRLGRRRCPIIRIGAGRRRAEFCSRCIVFGAAFVCAAQRRHALALWLAVSANAIVGGALIGWTIDNVPIESLGVGGWPRSLAFAAVASLAPVVAERGDHARHAAASFRAARSESAARPRSACAALSARF